MTQAHTSNLQHIVKAPLGLPPQKRQPITWDMLCAFANAILQADQQQRPLSTLHVQAVSRLDSVLMDLKRTGEVKDFKLGEFDGDQMQVFITVQDERYFRRYLMPIRERLREAVDALRVSLKIDIDTDFNCDHSPAAY